MIIDVNKMGVASCIDTFAQNFLNRLRYTIH